MLSDGPAGHPVRWLNETMPNVDEAWSRDRIPDQTGRTAVITGANSGIGLAAATELARRGADVIMVCRNAGRAAEARRIIDAAGPGAVDVVLADMSEPDEVERAADEIAGVGTVGRTGRLDLLINNAGLIVPGGHAENSVGWELNFATNYVGGFLVARHLLPLYRDVEGARVVEVSSLAHGHVRDLRWPDPNSPEVHGYAAYGQSKLACLMFGRELDRRLAAAASSPYGAARARCVIAHPGIAATAFMGRLPGILGRIGEPAVRRLFADAEEGADPLLAAATDATIPGGSFIGPTGLFEATGAVGPAKSSKASLDAGTRARLWSYTEDLTGVNFVV